MDFVALVKDFADYNLWANKQLVEWLKTKPAELMDSEVPSSFTSIKQTLVHIWDTQKWWLEVLQRLQPESNYGRIFEGKLEDVFDGMVKHSEEFAAYATSLTESSLREECQFSIPYVGEFIRPRFEMIQHCVTHATYHRGQIVTIGRNVGLVDAPMTDYMFYLLMAKRQPASPSLKIK